MNDPYTQGWNAAGHGFTEDDNPYEHGTEDFTSWLTGFQDFTYRIDDTEEDEDEEE